MEPITHVIFDMDGLLLNTETLYTIAQEAVAQRHGPKPFTWATKAKMMGQKATEAAQIFITDLKLDDILTPEEFLVQREVILDELFAKAELMPGAERLLQHLHSNGVPIALATSSHDRHFQLKTSLHRELFSLFDHVITGNEVVRGKPSPDIFLLAAQRWENTPSPPSPAHCLVFEDAPSGMVAAKAAGMHCILVPDANLEEAHRLGADEIIDSLLDFSPEKYGLPPFL